MDSEKVTKLPIQQNPFLKFSVSIKKKKKKRKKKKKGKNTHTHLRKHIVTLLPMIMCSVSLFHHKLFYLPK